MARTARTRRAALVSFGALAVAGILFAAAFAASPGAAFGPAPGHASVVGRLATLLAIVAPQIAFVAGVLALLRVLQRRRATVVPRAEAAVLVRRAVVGLGAGMASMIGLGVIAIAYNDFVASWWTTLTVGAAGVGLAALIAATPFVLAAARVSPVAEGPPGDVFDDLGDWGPPALRGRPWTLALLVAGAVAVAIAVVGAAASDGYDGALRGLGDGLLCLLGFATLGRYLGLWRPGHS